MNLFDTAEVYGLGRSEYLCGKFRRDYKGPDKGGIVVGESWEARRSRTCLDSLGACLIPVLRRKISLQDAGPVLQSSVA